MRDYDLKLLRETCEKIAQTLHYTARNMIPEAVNWRDLHCVAALRVEYDTGEIEYRVEVEEAAPDANKLQTYIAEELKSAGFPDVRVYTEW